MYGFCVLNLPNMFPKFTKIWKEVRTIKCNTTLCSISIFIYIYFAFWWFGDSLNLCASYVPVLCPCGWPHCQDLWFLQYWQIRYSDPWTPVRSLPCMKQPNFQQQYVLRNDFDFLPIFCYFFASCGIQILLENEGHHMNEQTAKPNQSVLQFVCLHFNRPQHTF